MLRPAAGRGGRRESAVVGVSRRLVGNYLRIGLPADPVGSFRRADRIRS